LAQAFGELATASTGVVVVADVEGVGVFCAVVFLVFLVEQACVVVLADDFVDDDVLGKYD